MLPGDNVESPTPRIGWAASLALLAIAILAFAATIRLTGPQLSWDGFDFAQIAREVERGHGNTTLVLPWTMVGEAGRDGRMDARWPNQLRSPLAVYTIAAIFRVRGSSELNAALFSGIYYIGTVLMIFWCFAPVMGQPVAFLSAIVFAFSRSGLVYARSGLTELAAMFWLLVALTAIVRSRRRRIPGAIAAGLAMAICSLYRPVAIVWIVGFAAVLLVERKQWLRSVLVMMIVYFVVAIGVPATFGWSTSRAPVAINLAHRVGDSAEAMRDPVRFVLDHPVGMIRKAVIEFGRPVVYAFDFGGVPLFSALGLFAVVLLRPRDETQQRIRWMTIAAIVLNAVVLAVLIEGDAFAGPLRYFDVFAPLLIPWGMLALQHVLEHSTAPRWLQVAMFVLFVAGMGVQSARDPFVKQPPLAMIEDVKRIIPKDDVMIASTFAPNLAWYADRRNIYTYFDAEHTLAAVRGLGLEVRWYFAPAHDLPPPGFRLVKEWPQVGFSLWQRADLPAGS